MDHELLQTLSGLFDKKLEPIHNKLNNMNNHLEIVESRLDAMDKRFELIEFKQDHMSKKLDDLQLDLKFFERGVKREIHSLKDQTDTVIEILKVNDLIPQ